MDHEIGIFKRYIRKRNGKEVTQVGVSGLSVNSKFDDNEEIVVLSKDDFTQMETQVQTLETQLNEAKLEIETLKNNSNSSSNESPKHYNKVIELQEMINNRNGLLMETQNTINSIILEVTQQYNKLGTKVTKANGKTKDNIVSLLSELQTITSTLLDYDKELQNQITGINSSIDNTSWFKWIRSKNKFKIVLDTDNLKRLEVQLNEFNNTDTVEKANELLTPVEIPTGNLDKLTSNDLDLTDLFIKLDTESTENIITVQPPEEPKHE